MSIDEKSARQLGARHLLADSGIDRAFQNKTEKTTVVRVSATPEYVRTAAGQHLLSFLVNLLSRQFGVIHQIELCVPEAALLPCILQFGGKANLRDSMLATATAITGNSMRIVSSATPDTYADVEINVGWSAGADRAGVHVNAVADGWRAFVGGHGKCPNVCAKSSNPIGPYFAACVAAGEAFKHVKQMDRTAGKFLESFCACLWSFASGESWDGLPPEGPEPVSLIPPFCLVGAGAVGQAALAAVSAMKGLKTHVTVIDDDVLDKEGTNLNRCVLSVQSDCEMPKVAIVERRLKATGISVLPVQKKWEEFVYDSESRAKQLPDLCDLEKGFRYELVLSCVDIDSSRLAIQRFWPKLILGGSTLSMGLTVACYDMRTTYECLACSAVIGEMLTLEKAAHRLRGLAPEAARAEAERLNIDWKLIEAYLQRPQCGSLAEQEMRKFIANSQSPAWSVGFVSAASGVVLAAALLRQARLGRTPLEESQGNAIRFSFLNPDFRITRHRRSSSCECNTIGRKAFNQLWNRDPEENPIEKLQKTAL